jgi:hypothetical protein
MDVLLKVLRKLSVPPSDSASYDSSLTFEDAVTFLKENVHEDQFVFHANLPNVFIHSMLVPLSSVNPPIAEDLLSWHCDAYSGWSIVVSYHPIESIAIAPPLSGTGSIALDQGEQLLFARQFEGRIGEKHYFEFLQKFLQVSDLHYLSERNAYCRFDRHGDIEEVIRVLSVPDTGENSDGAVVTVTREVLERYATLTGTAVVRTYDLTRFRPAHFGGWRSGKDAIITDEPDFFYRIHLEPGHASYIRGCQVVRSHIAVDTIAREFHPTVDKNARYESYIAVDWRNQDIREISCAPGATANYFTKSSLPFEISPAFFRPEVLSKYKADSEKYKMTGRTISCRGTWSLNTYDTNDAGQVHTYLVYLRNLPYEEQLHWKIYNEAPKGSISQRAYLRDFEGSWEEFYDPLDSIKEEVGKLQGQRTPWWTLRSDDSIDRAHYPVTDSADEWANEILHLDQLIIESFEKSWFKKQLTHLGLKPDANVGSLMLIEAYLGAASPEATEAQNIVAPLKELHELRSKLKGHAVGRSTLSKIRQKALNQHGSYKKHFRALCQRCDESLRRIENIVKEQHPIRPSSDQESG